MNSGVSLMFLVLKISTQFQQEEICNFKAWRITFVWKVPGTKFPTTIYRGV